MKIKTILLIFSLSFALLNFNQKVQFKIHKPCTFTIKLPSSFSFKPLEDEKSPDYCDYIAKTKSGIVVAECHSLTKGRFMSEDIKTLFIEGQKTEDLEITYKVQKDNWFVISGIIKSTKEVYYWKRSVGKYYISDLNIQYNKKDAKLIEPYMGKISSSFISD